MTQLDACEALFAIAHPEAIRVLHKFRDMVLERDCIMHPVATAEDIAALEQFFGITLPVEYSLFLRVVGNGVEDEDAEIHIEGIPVRQALSESQWEDVKEIIQRPCPLQDNQYKYHSLRSIRSWERENNEQAESKAEKPEPIAHNFEAFEQGIWTLNEYFEGVYLVVCGDEKETSGRITPSMTVSMKSQASQAYVPLHL